MPKPSRQADLVRQWREHKDLSLETVAFAIEQLAKLRGIPPTSKKIPRTHASLSRWETGEVELKELGLELIAEALGLTVEEIRNPPPRPGTAPVRQVTVPAEDAKMVEAYVEGLRSRRTEDR